MNNAQAQLLSTQSQHHPFCLVCSSSNPYGLGLKIHADEHGGVHAKYVGHAALQGYSGLMHGGVIASLLDGVMTNCLFASGIAAVTAELVVRYVKPVLIGPELEIRAWIEGNYSVLYRLRAELKQEGIVKATASAKFMRQEDPLCASAH